MTFPNSSMPSRIDVTLPEACRTVIAQVCDSKHITPHEVINVMLLTACRGLQEHGMRRGVELSADLDLVHGRRMEIMHRADEVVAVMERLALDASAQTQAMHQRLRGGAP